MKVLRHTTTVREELVVLSEPGDPELLRMILPDHPDYQGWMLDLNANPKFILVRDYTIDNGTDNDPQ